MAKTITIGRSPDSSIVVDKSFDTVSGSHAELTLLDDGRLQFTDFSRNGSIINDTPVHNKYVYVSTDDVIVLASSYTLDWKEVINLIPELAHADTKRTQRRGDQPIQPYIPSEHNNDTSKKIERQVSSPYISVAEPVPDSKNNKRKKSGGKSNLPLILAIVTIATALVAFLALYVFDDLILQYWPF